MRLTRQSQPGSPMGQCFVVSVLFPLLLCLCVIIARRGRLWCYKEGMSRLSWCSHVLLVCSSTPLGWTRAWWVSCWIDRGVAEAV